MKLTNLVFGLLATSLFVFAGCKKPVKPVEKVGDVVIDLQKIYDLSNGTSQDVKTHAAQLQSDIRYRQYVQALGDLDAIVNDPSLSPAQKKEAEDLIGQVKTLAQNPPPQ